LQAPSFAATLFPHQPDVVGRRPDESEPALLDGGREIGVFRQKAETGMDRVYAGYLPDSATSM
jgi:hypothetical protein